MSNDHKPNINRRDFIRRAGGGAALAGMGVMGSKQADARNEIERADPRAPKTGGLLQEGETIGIAVIGVGGKGGSHLKQLCTREKQGRNLQVRAIADCYTKRLTDRQGIAKGLTGRTVETYYNYREVLERGDVHGVVIATPDHWHAQLAIDAMEAGKDVYCEKPVTLTIEESLEVRDAAYRTGRVFQCGAHRASEDFYWQARRLIKEGAIGKVLWAQADYSRNSGNAERPQGGEWNYTIDPAAGPTREFGEDYVDWDMWLGPAKKRPWNPARFFQFRKFWDYSGGIATDLLYHYIAPLTIAMDVSAPERASAAGGVFMQYDEHLPPEQRREVPDTFMVTLDYPEECTLVLTSSMANSSGNPLMIRGHRATLTPHADGVHLKAEKNFKDWFVKRFGAEETVIPLEKREGHLDNWLNAMRSRGETHCSAETAYRAQAATKMGVDSYKQDRMIFWDNENEKYVRKHPRPNRVSKYPRKKA
jgi:predicted dehydrogenase